VVGFAIAIAIGTVVTATSGFVEGRERGACTVGGINVRPQKVEGVGGEGDGLSDAILDNDLVIEAVSDLGDGSVVGDGETEVHVGKVEDPDLVASVGVFEIEPKPFGETVPKQFSVAHSEGGGDSGDLVTGLSSIVVEHGEGEAEGGRVLVVEGGCISMERVGGTWVVSGPPWRQSWSRRGCCSQVVPPRGAHVQGGSEARGGGRGGGAGSGAARVEA